MYILFFHLLRRWLQVHLLRKTINTPSNLCRSIAMLSLHTCTVVPSLLVQTVLSGGPTSLGSLLFLCQIAHLFSNILVCAKQKV